MKSFKKLFPAALSLMMFCGCSSAGNSYDTVEMNAYKSEASSDSAEMVYSEAPAEEMGASDIGDMPIVQPSDQAKRIYSGSVTIETKDFAASRAKLNELTEKAGGFIQDENLDAAGISGGSNASQVSSGWFQLRIPTDHFDQFFSDMSEVGSVTNQSRSAENITQAYTETVDRKESLQTQLNRLNELMAQAENLSDVIAIEDQITQTEAELKAANADLAGMDLDLDYSRISVSLYQVSEYTPTDNGFWAQIGNAFQQTWIVFIKVLCMLLTLLIYLLPWMLVAAAAVLIIRFFVKRKKPEKNKNRKPADLPDVPSSDSLADGQKTDFKAEDADSDKENSDPDQKGVQDLKDPE